MYNLGCNKKKKKIISKHSATGTNLDARAKYVSTLKNFQLTHNEWSVNPNEYIFRHGLLQNNVLKPT